MCFNLHYVVPMGVCMHGGGTGGLQLTNVPLGVFAMYVMSLSSVQSVVMMETNSQFTQ